MPQHTFTTNKSNRVAGTTFLHFTPRMVGRGLNELLGKVMEYGPLNAEVPKHPQMYALVRALWKVAEEEDLPSEAISHCLRNIEWGHGVFEGTVVPGQGSQNWSKTRKARAIYRPARLGKVYADRAEKYVQEMIAFYRQVHAYAEYLERKKLAASEKPQRQQGTARANG